MTPLAFEPLDDSSFYSRMALLGGRSLVCFTSAGCGTCRVLEARLPALAAGLVDHLVRIDAQHSAGLVSEYEVFHLPTVFLFVDGRHHARLEFELDRAAVESSLRAALAAPAQEAP